MKSLTNAISFRAEEVSTHCRRVQVTCYKKKNLSTFEWNYVDEDGVILKREPLLPEERQLFLNEATVVQGDEEDLEVEEQEEEEEVNIKKKTRPAKKV